MGDLVDWISEPTTKIVVVGDPERMDDLGARLRASFDGRLFIAKSLPEFLEVAEPDVSKGSGLHLVCEHLGIEATDVVAFGDDQNDRELLQEAGTAWRSATPTRRWPRWPTSPCPGRRRTASPGSCRRWPRPAE